VHGPANCQSTDPQVSFEISSPNVDAAPCRLSVSVDWGDGSPIQNVTVSGAHAPTFVEPIADHTYRSPGVYTVRDSGSVLSGPLGCVFVGKSYRFTLEKASACASVTFIGVPGAGEAASPDDQQLGGELDAVERRLAAELRPGGLGVRVTAVTYATASSAALELSSAEQLLLRRGTTGLAEAVGLWKERQLAAFLAGIPAAAGVAVADVHSAVLACPSSRIVLAGYSQGAMAIHLAELRIASGDRALLAHVAGTILLADGYRVPNTGAAERLGSAPRAGQGVGPALHELGAHDDVPLPASTVDVCNRGDALCDFSERRTLPGLSAAIKVDTSYGDGPLADLAAGWIGHLILPGPGSPAPQSPPSGAAAPPAVPSPPVVPARATTTTVACLPASVQTGSATTCTATVTDAAAGAAGTPTGAASFTSSPTTGAFGGASACTLSAASAGTASCDVTFTPTAIGTYAVAASYHGDGQDEPSSASSSSALRAYGPLTHFTTSLPAAVYAGAPATVTVYAEDAADDVIAGYDGSAVIWSDTSGDVPVGTALHAFVDGVSSGNEMTVADPARSDQITVTDGTITSVGAVFTVYGPLTHFAVGLPAAAYAGAPIAVEVYAEDAADDVIAGYDSSTVTWSDTSGDVPDGTALNAFVDGVSSGDTTTVVSPTRSDQITVTDGAVTSVSVVFTVYGPLTHFVIGVRVPVEAGTPVTVTVYAEDAAGDVIADYDSGTVTWSDTSGDVPPGTALNAFVDGVSSGNTTTVASPTASDTITVTDGTIASSVTVSVA
jgi:cutinase